MSDLSSEQPVEPTSQMAILLQRHDEITSNQELRLRIPRWVNPEIVVTYKPVDHVIYAQVMDQVGEIKGAQQAAEANMTANIDLLVGSCLGIDAKGGDIDHHWSGFNPDLCDALSIPIKTARAACQKLFVTDGDILATARRLVEWSGFTNREIAEGFSGE